MPHCIARACLTSGCDEGIMTMACLLKRLGALEAASGSARRVARPEAGLMTGGRMKAEPPNTAPRQSSALTRTGARPPWGRPVAHTMLD
jgi:hypothetical protein